MLEFCVANSIRMIVARTIFFFGLDDIKCDTEQIYCEIVDLFLGKVRKEPRVSSGRIRTKITIRYHSRPANNTPGSSTAAYRIITDKPPGQVEIGAYMS